MSVFNYSFTKTVTKSAAFADYLDHNFAVETTASVEQDTVIIQTTVELTTDQQAALQTLVTNYSDPDIFLQLSYTESLSGVSQSTTSTTLQDVQSFIFPSLTRPNGDNAQPDGSVLDSLKSILKLTVDDVSTCSDLDTGSVAVQIYDYSRSMVISDLTVDVSSVLAAWKAMALNSQTGPQTNYKSFQIFGLSTKASTADCIWALRLSVSDTRFRVRLNGFQKLFYFRI